MTVVARVVRPLVVAIVFLCLLPVASMTADNPSKIAAAMDRAFLPLLKEHDVPGIAVAATIGGRRYFFNYGVASQESSRPVTQNTLFEIGSISKTVAATLASYAQALGKISLEDHPGKYIPQLQGSAIDQASLLNLGTYTAGGLPLQVPNDDANNAEMIA